MKAEHERMSIEKQDSPARRAIRPFAHSSGKLHSPEGPAAENRHNEQIKRRIGDEKQR
jgi:hypothetical protein